MLHEKILKKKFASGLYCHSCHAQRNQMDASFTAFSPKYGSFHYFWNPPFTEPMGSIIRHSQIMPAFYWIYFEMDQLRGKNWLWSENWLLTNTFMSTNAPHHLCFFLVIFPTHIYHKQYKYLMISSLFITLLWKCFFSLMLLLLFCHTFWSFFGVKLLNCHDWITSYW